MPKHGFAVLVFFLFSIKDICMLEKNGYVAKKVSEYDQEIPQSETADKPWMEPFWNSGVCSISAIDESYICNPNLYTVKK